MFRFDILFLDNRPQLYLPSASRKQPSYPSSARINDSHKPLSFPSGGVEDILYISRHWCQHNTLSSEQYLLNKLSSSFQIIWQLLLQRPLRFTMFPCATKHNTVKIAVKAQMDKNYLSALYIQIVLLILLNHAEKKTTNKQTKKTPGTLAD